MVLFGHVICSNSLDSLAVCVFWMYAGRWPWKQPDEIYTWKERRWYASASKQFFMYLSFVVKHQGFLQLQRLTCWTKLWTSECCSVLSSFCLRVTTIHHSSCFYLGFKRLFYQCNHATWGGVESSDNQTRFIWFTQRQLENWCHLLSGGRQAAAGQ